MTVTSLRARPPQAAPSAALASGLTPLLLPSTFGAFRLLHQPDKVLDFTVFNASPPYFLALAGVRPSWRCLHISTAFLKAATALARDGPFRYGSRFLFEASMLLVC